MSIPSAFPEITDSISIVRPLELIILSIVGSNYECIFGFISFTETNWSIRAFLEMGLAGS